MRRRFDRRVTRSRKFGDFGRWIRVFLDPESFRINDWNAVAQLPVGYLLITNVSPSLWRAPVLCSPQAIGRLPECDIVIPGEYEHVSRRHALVGSQQDGLWIKDLGSSGGTQLNGVPLVPNCQTRVMVGDRVSLAGLELYVVSPEASVLHEDDETSVDDEQLSTSGTIHLLGRRATKSMGDARLRCLSPAELEVVRWICRGSTTIEEIGEQLFRSPHTVRTQLGSIFRKLEVHSREQLLALLRQCEIAWTQPEMDEVRDPLLSPTERFSFQKTDYSLETTKPSSRSARR